MTDNSLKPKLFLFCIGGTGSRVLKALTFLLGSGAKIDASRIIPIIIDPDRSNGDVIRTIETLKKYQSIQRKLADCQDIGFFQTPIQTLSELGISSSQNKDIPAELMSSGFRIGIDGTKEGRFKEFVNYDMLSLSDKALMSTLFTNENLNAPLKVGFKGNPHMGSIVLNRFSSSDDFKFFASNFNQNDRIFIVSSIFGGTGAAGFPLLIKNLRSPRPEIRNKEYLRNSRIGAITVKPYFGVKQQKGGTINSGTFISKTKAALEYYHLNITGNNSLNALYYIGDTQTKDYSYNEGENRQENYAHLVEFLGATAILEFMGYSDSELQSVNGKAFNPKYYEYGLLGNVSTVKFPNLGKRTISRVFKPLTQYFYANIFWHQLEFFESNQPWTHNLDDTFLKSEFFSTNLSQFNKRFDQWLEEMAQNERKFKPFKLEISKNSLHMVVEGIRQNKIGIIPRERWGFNQYLRYLNEASNQISFKDPAQRFMAVFYRATEKIFEERIPNTF